MPDDPSNRGGQDRKRIDVSQEHELRTWSKKFGVTQEKLKKAVADVGTQVEKVAARLRGGGKPPSDRKPMKRAEDR